MDLNLDLIKLIQAQGCYVIGSKHDFNSTPEPEEIIKILHKAKEFKADILKAAFMPNSERDVINLINASAKYHAENLNDLKLLSVIIPAYNTAKFLNKCVASIAEQTYQNIEIVIVNNGSTDSTPEICEELKAKYNNRIFKIINLNPNQGINFARRAGFEAASGDYVTTIDSDDYIDLSAYEKAIKVLEENNLDMVQFGYYDVYTDGRIIEAHKLQPVKFNNARDSFKNFASIIIDHLTLLWDKVYKRELFE
ncbi:MAG: type I 3-dehydroquinate dehydratase, partial [Synergistaceae bacterium]|nr:type I 3-dehydroquinate dehydratase [Synergistaceae bacterium]